MLLQFPDTVEFCEEMANLGKTVIVAALDGTFQRKVSVCLCLSTCPYDTGKQTLQTQQNVQDKKNIQTTEKSAWAAL